MINPRCYYDPSDTMVTLEYAVNTTGDQLFIPGNNQVYGDNPDAGTMAQRRACNERIIGSTMTGVDPASGNPTYVCKGKEQ